MLISLSQHFVCHDFFSISLLAAVKIGGNIKFDESLLINNFYSLKKLVDSGNNEPTSLHNKGVNMFTSDSASIISNVEVHVL